LKNLIGVIRVLDLLANLGRIRIERGFEEGLRVVHFIRVYIREELGQLIIAISCVSVVLNLIVRKAQKG
jgi:hypothetical protein